MMTFFSTKKKFRPASQNGRFPILTPSLRPLSGIEKRFFLKIQLTRIVFSGEIHRELPCRWYHYIIISGSRSKVEKTMQNSVFSEFDCDPEIMLEELEHYGNHYGTSDAKNSMINVLFHKNKKIPSYIAKRSFSDFETEPETPFGNRKFFISKLNLLV